MEENYEMKKFIYKFIIKPKHERPMPTLNETLHMSVIVSFTIIIMTFIIGHYAVEMYKYNEQSKITDSCRVRYIISDIGYGTNYMCKSYLHPSKYYVIHESDVYENTPMYIHRRLWINENGTINTKIYDGFNLEYTAK